MFELATAAFAEIEIKKSRFLGQLYPIHTRQQALQILAEQRTQHPQAVHVCSVLLCDTDSSLDDDGEPSGTAAKPMYNVLVHKQLSHVLAVVVRYWGGSKLGAGGLTRAYSQAISETFKNAQLIAVEAMQENRFAVKFADEASLRRLCEQQAITVLNADYSSQAERAVLHLKMKLNQAAQFEQDASNLLRGDLQKIEEDQKEN